MSFHAKFPPRFQVPVATQTPSAVGNVLPPSGLPKDTAIVRFKGGEKPKTGITSFGGWGPKKGRLPFRESRERGRCRGTLCDAGRNVLHFRMNVAIRGQKFPVSQAIRPPIELRYDAPGLPY